MGFSLSWRQRLQIRAARARRWEFWPAWLFYLPIIGWIIWLGLRFRHPTAFTAANPGMDDGGVVGERKSPLLLALRRALPDATPAAELLPATLPAAERLRRAQAFASGQYPVVLKPEIGQRGRGVAIIRSAEQLATYLSAADFDVLAQAFVAGEEFGIFVYRDPSDDAARIFSITCKRLPQIVGDGVSSIGELIWRHPRARLSAPLLLRQHAARLDQVLPGGVAMPLVELGSHCRGAVFEDGANLASEPLLARLRQILAGLPGFHFGRLDIIAPDAAALSAGRGLQVLEVNGVTSEAAHVYHPGTPLLTGYRVFFAQWWLAFAIGQRNRARGAATVSPLRLLRLFLQDLKRHDVAQSCADASRQIPVGRGAATESSPR